MSHAILKKSGDSIVLTPVPSGRWKGSSIAEVFESGGDSRMACGIHDIPASETTNEHPTVDDILYILDGEMEIRSAGAVEHFGAGDFAYLRAGAPRTIVVPTHVRLIYITYPSQWK